MKLVHETSPPLANAELWIFTVCMPLFPPSISFDWNTHCNSPLPSLFFLYIPPSLPSLYPLFLPSLDNPSSSLHLPLSPSLPPSPAKSGHPPAPWRPARLVLLLAPPTHLLQRVSGAAPRGRVARALLRGVQDEVPSSLRLSAEGEMQVDN